MKRIVTAEDVLNEIEFELVQGAISRNELDQSIQAVRKFQNEMRTEVFQSPRGITEGREIVSRQFHLNDMLLTLLQEMVAAVQAVQLQLRRVGRVSRQARPPAATTYIPATPEDVEADAALGSLEDDGLTDASLWRPPAEIEEAMRSEALNLDLEARPVRVPLIGGLIGRLRLSLHQLVLFYIGRLARKQAAINRTYGDWILYLNSLHQQQQEEIAALNEQVAALQTRLAEIEAAAPPPATSGPQSR